MGKLVVLLCTNPEEWDHRVQMGYPRKGTDATLEAIQDYKALVRRHAEVWQVRAIGEELPSRALELAELDRRLAEEGKTLGDSQDVNRIKEELQTNPPSSAAQNVANDRDLAYRQCDLSYEEQEKQDLLPSQQPPNETHKEWLERTSPPREKHWLMNLQALDKWPVLFICGHDHQDTFCQRLKKADLEVEVLPNKLSMEGD